MELGLELSLASLACINMLHGQVSNPLSVRRCH